MDPSRHHEYVGINDHDRSRTITTYYSSSSSSSHSHDVPETMAQHMHQYYAPSQAAAGIMSHGPPAPRGHSNPRKPTCDCTTTPSGTSIICNGCRLNANEDMWPPMAAASSTSSSPASSVNAASDPHANYHRHMMATEQSGGSLRSPLRRSPMYMQHQQPPPPPPPQQPPTSSQLPPPHMMQHAPSPSPSSSQQMVHAHTPTSHIGDSRSNSYWPSASSQRAAVSGPHYAEERMAGPLPPPGVHPTTQTQVDSSITRRSAAPTSSPLEGGVYGQYKSSSISANAANASHPMHSSYGQPTSSTNHLMHARGVGGPPPASQVGSHYVTKERIYEHTKYSSTTTTTTKIAYNSTSSAASAAAVYENHHHHHQHPAIVTGKNMSAIDHHVINPSNLPASKEQHPSPNYARKCPQMYTPEAEPSTAHHHYLYMPTPTFSSDKFTRASPQHTATDYQSTSLREHSLQSASSSPAACSSPYMRESPSQFVHQSGMSRNPSSSYNSCNTNPNHAFHPSTKVQPPEMSPIIMKQSHGHYQYSSATKSPLQPTVMPPSMSTHQMHHQVPPGARPTSAAVLAPPGNPPPPPTAQRYIIESVKREDVEIFEQPPRNAGAGAIYLNPYNTPPPTGDGCCKEVNPLSNSSSPYTTSTMTPNYRGESPQFYPTKYAKMAMAQETPPGGKHSIIQQNTPPPSRAPSQRGHQQPAYYYEGHPHSAPSPAAATAASPSPSSLLSSSTTISHTQMHHTEYVTTPLQAVGPGGPSLGGHVLQSQAYPAQPTAQHQATTSNLRNSDLLIIGAQNHNSYERIVVQPHSHPQGQSSNPHPPSGPKQQGPPAMIPMPGASMVPGHHAIKTSPANAAAVNSTTNSKHQKPNYRELINRTLAIRSATSEEELNRQIIKKTLNVDTQGLRTAPGPVSLHPQSHVGPPPVQGSADRMALPSRQPLRPTEVLPVQTSTLGKPSAVGTSVLVANTSTIGGSGSLPRHELSASSRICIKQEDDKPSSSSSTSHPVPMSTSSSPLDLSMRTVKTKADSTEYKYNQQRHLTPNSSSEGGRYTLPRVDSTPVFSVDAFEPVTTVANDIPVLPMHNSRHRSQIERRQYVAPSQPQATAQVSATSSSTLGSHHHHQQPQQQQPSSHYHSQRRMDMPQAGVSVIGATSKGTYDGGSCVIKTAPKPQTVSAGGAVQSRPSVLETNPYASVIKTEHKRSVEPVTAVASSTQNTLAAVERLPPDTSIMPLPPRTSLPAQRPVAQAAVTPPIKATPSTTSSGYMQGCEKNPNFRKRHIQEYSNQMLAGESSSKQSRIVDTFPSKTQIAMRPADISVIAVNEVNQQELERLNKAKQPLEVLVPREETVGSVIASTTAALQVDAAKIKANANSSQHSHLSPSSTSTVVICKQEPLTPTGSESSLAKVEVKAPLPQLPPQSQPQPPPQILPQNLPQILPQPLQQPVSSQSPQVASARIRTKAELKGFTFNPPPMQPLPPPSEPPLPSPPAAAVSIKQEELAMTTVVCIKEEQQEAKIDLPNIEGLDDDFSETKLLDFGWSSTCNSFVEQLRTQPAKRKALNYSPLKMSREPVSDAQVTSTDAVVTKKPKENNFPSTESPENTRSSFTRLDGIESSMTLKSSMNQDSQNSPSSSQAPKKLTKSEREKKRMQQEKRLAERLQAKGSSSESEDELDKRKTDRLKKPPMKTKSKLKLPRAVNSNGSVQQQQQQQQGDSNNCFSDCGSDSSSETEEECVTKLKRAAEHSKLKKEKEPNQSDELKKIDETRPKKVDCKKSGEIIKHESMRNTPLETSNAKELAASSPIKQEPKEPSASSANSSEESGNEDEENDDDDDDDDDEEEEQDDGQIDKNEKNSKNEKTRSVAAGDNKKPPNHLANSQSNKFKVGLNTMTRSKRKKELELQLANSKVLRNDKIIRNSTTKIRRKYVRKYVTGANSINSESGGLSRESGIMKSTRLKAKLERKANSLVVGMAKNDKKANNSNKVLVGPHGKGVKGDNDHGHDPNVLELYRYKRALKVPPSLIVIKPSSTKSTVSLPDLERHAEALEAYANKKKKPGKNQDKQRNHARSSNSPARTEPDESQEQDEHRSIIDLLHSRVTKASGLNVRNKNTTTAVAKLSTNKTYSSFAPKGCSGNNNNNNNNNNCGMFSETSQTTESSELQMLPPLRQDSAEDEEEEDNDSVNGAAKKRHFSIFDTKVLPAKTRTESKMQQKRENIREIFVGDDRPASAPPEMTQALDSADGEKMTYEKKYKQFLEQMNKVLRAGRLGRTPPPRKLPSTATSSIQHGTVSMVNIKQEEGDTESTSVLDPDEANEDQKPEALVSQLPKKRGKYLRRKGSSGFDYIRKKKKPTPSSAAAGTQNHGCSQAAANAMAIKSEKLELDEYEYKTKTEDDVSREIQKWVLNKSVGQSAMHKAARQGYMDVIVYCLDRMGMNPDLRDNAGYTALHEACTAGRLDIARILMQYGANHSPAAHSGIRPLHEAVEYDHQEIVRLLLSYGADPQLATYSGQTPLMLASSTTMRDILRNHLVDVQSMGPDRKPWRLNGPWDMYDPAVCGYNVFEGAPNALCDMSRALLRKGSLTSNQMLQNRKLHALNNSGSGSGSNNNLVAAGATTAAANAAAATAAGAGAGNGKEMPSADTEGSSSHQGNVQHNGPTNAGAHTANGPALHLLSMANLMPSTMATAPAAIAEKANDITSAVAAPPKGETNTKTVMEKCAVVLDKIDRFNAVRLNNNESRPEILVENSDSDGEMFEFEEADVLLPPLYLLKDEGTNDKWVLLSDLCNLLKVKSKDTLLNKIYPSSSASSSASSSSASAVGSSAIAHKSLMRELKMSDFLEKATCLQLLCAGEKVNICASKVVLIKYNENVRNLLGVKTILMKF